MKRNLIFCSIALAMLIAAVLILPGFPARAGSQGQETQEAIPLPHPLKDSHLWSDAGDSSWLGVETREVTPEGMKDLHLPAERGVIISSVVPDSPAARAGFHEKDVITEMNGEHIEGVVQFRRMIRETPAGRTVHLAVWRNGGTQTVAATLGRMQDTPGPVASVMPGEFAMHMPDIPEIPRPDWNVPFGMASSARIGVEAEDLSGQLASYFGTPEGGGVLVRAVEENSSAGKAGLKAGDVILSVNGERVRSLGDLRAHLAPKSDTQSVQSVKLGVLRNRSELTVTLELPAVQRHTVHGPSFST